jgi:ADP-heptose:LPS heptosyltransferase
MVTVDGRPVLLSLRALGLGDLLTAVPALRALRRAFPDHCHVVATPAALLPIVSATGAVDEVEAYEGLGDRIRSQALPEVCGQPDVAVNLHGSGPDSHRALLRTGPGRLLAFAHPEVPESADGPPWPPDAHEVWRWCGLLTAFGIAADPTDLDLPVPEAPSGAEGATVIHPGATSGARRWPLDRFVEVARAETATGRQVVVTGTGPERLLVDHLVQRAGLPPEANRCDTDLRQLMAVVGQASRVVCGDTGVAHLATALGTPSVVLFGPTAPSRWGPPVDRPWHRALWSGRTGDPHATEPDPGLLQLTVDDVLAALADLPANPARPGRP